MTLRLMNVYTYIPAILLASGSEPTLLVQWESLFEHTYVRTSQMRMRHHVILNTRIRLTQFSWIAPTSHQC